MYEQCICNGSKSCHNFKVKKMRVWLSRHHHILESDTKGKIIRLGAPSTS